MESTVVGISSVESKDVPTPNGKQPTGTLYIIKDAVGVEYTTFDRDLGVQAAAYKGNNQPATIGFETKSTVKGDKTYTNRYLKSLGAANGSAPAPAPIVVEQSVPLATTSVVTGAVTAPPVAIQTQPSHSDREESIARAVALKAAVDLASNGVLEDSTANGILARACQFESYLLGDDKADLPATAAVTGADDIPF